MNNWNASRTNNEQGTDFREISINGKISELQFTIKPNSDFWRAGFKLFDPNGTILPLRSKNSLLFHLGSTPSSKEYGFTAYRNGEWVKELNKTKEYPQDRVLTIRLEVNHNNFLKVFINGSLEFKPAWHLENPNVREKTALVAWGDENDYGVDFTDITASDWKTVRSKTEKQQVTHKSSLPMLHVSGNENVFVNSKIDGSTQVGGRKNLFVKTNIKNTNNKEMQPPWYKDPKIIVPAVAVISAAVISAPWWTTLLSQHGKESLNIAQNNLKQETAVSQPPHISLRLGLVRGLESLETGKKISELPNEVYFYASPVVIEYEIENIGVDLLRSSSFSNGYKFELQKSRNRYYLLGFVSDETYSRISGVNSTKPMFTILYPNSWGGATHAIAVPFDAVNSIDYRDLELDAKTKITVFDIGFKEVIDNPAIHR